MVNDRDSSDISLALEPFHLGFDSGHQFRFQYSPVDSRVGVGVYFDRDVLLLLLRSMVRGKIGKHGFCCGVTDNRAFRHGDIRVRGGRKDDRRVIVLHVHKNMDRII